MELINNTVFLPKTDFPMKASLQQLDKIITKWWEDPRHYQEFLNKNKNNEPFVLLMGPPYANGSLHLGHLVNLILKNLCIRYKNLTGYYTPIIPGWDCHGLPIELKVEELRKNNKNKDNQNKDKKDLFKNKEQYKDLLLEFRKECRDFANNWQQVQEKEMKSFGFIADYKNKYSTLSNEAIQGVFSCLFKSLEKGYIYRDMMPIMWSTAECTSLSDAEIEYKDDHISTSVDFVCRITLMPKKPELTDSLVMMWTTTPWTLPSNQACCYRKDLVYSLVKINHFIFWVAKNLIKDVCDRIKTFHNINEDFSILREETGDIFEGAMISHPVYETEVPMLEGDHVFDTIGTGFVHTAPAHGEEDFIICKKNNIIPIQYVNENGFFSIDTPEFNGLNIFEGQKEIIEYMGNDIVTVIQYQHSYPFSARGKVPMIFRLSEQWFLDIEKSCIRKKALELTEKIKWIPSDNRNRMKSMLENRGQWCLSRQRLHGVIIPFFTNKKSGEVLNDKIVNNRIFKALKESGDNGCDFWYKEDPRMFLIDLYNINDFDPSYDVVDVWFESGVVFSYSLQSQKHLMELRKKNIINNEENSNYIKIKSITDILIEGVDQYRGWFQSTLLTSIANDNVANIGGKMFQSEYPYSNILSHGFVLDDNGRKMSKSLGNIISAQEALEKSGIDILNLSVISVEFSQDIKIGPKIWEAQSEIYRKIRNVLKYLIGVTESSHLLCEKDIDNMDILEQWMINRLILLNKKLTSLVNDFDFKNIVLELYRFITTDLSSFYMEIRKDLIYCGDVISNLKRNESIYVFTLIRNFLIHWLKPLLPITTEEAFHFITKNNIRNIDLTTLTSVHSVNIDLGIITKENIKNKNILQYSFDKIENIRTYLTSWKLLIEEARQKKIIGSGLEVDLYVSLPVFLIGEESLVEDLLQISSLFNTEDNQKRVEKSIKEKCNRCWKHTDLSIINVKDSTFNVCKRCSLVLLNYKN
jgi:isoleucyl-tRNA synthetase